MERLGPAAYKMLRGPWLRLMRKGTASFVLLSLSQQVRKEGDDRRAERHQQQRPEQGRKVRD